MSHTGIVVVGDSLLDRDVQGTVERLCPDAPVPVLDEQMMTARPGGAALAASLAALDGDPVTLVTALGDDGAAQELRALLARAGVDVIAVPSHRPTPEKVRLLAGTRPLLRLDRGGSSTSTGAIPDLALGAVSDGDVVVVSDYGRGLTGRAELSDALRTRRRPTLWDPHPRGSAPVPFATLISPNLAELCGAFPGPIDGMRSIVERTAAARRAWQAQAVITTLAADGAVLVAGDGPPLVIPALAVSGGDPCGAGDRFITAVAHRLLHGALLSEAVTEAVAAAGYFVAGGGARTHGASAPSGTAAVASPGPIDVLPATSAQHTSVAAAERLVARVRAAGGTVVVAGGCFDLLHAGHLSLLESARRLGDCLIVALNSDASVRRLKGAGRPVVPQADRAALLLALSCVDAVAVFEEDSPVELLRQLRPDMFTKGGDYSAHTLPEAPLLQQWGGQAVVLPYLSGRSSTGLLKLANSLP